MSLFPHFFVIPLLLLWTHLIYTMSNLRLWNFINCSFNTKTTFIQLQRRNNTKNKKFLVPQEFSFFALFLLYTCMYECCFSVANSWRVETRNSLHCKSTMEQCCNEDQKWTKDEDEDSSGSEKIPKTKTKILQNFEKFLKTFWR